MKWTPAETEELLRLHEGGATWDEIAGALQLKFKQGFSAPMVRGKGRRLGLRANQVARALVSATSNPATQREVEKLMLREQKVRQRLQQQLKTSIESHNTPVAEYFGKKAIFGVIADTQYGSLYDRHDLVGKAYEIMAREGIKNVFHAGDICDGVKMYRGHEYELECHGADAQVEHVTKTHPRHKGMRTYFILGNHDISFWKHGGLDIGKMIAVQREDMTYIGMDEATVPLKIDGTILRIMLAHPAGGTAYAISWRSQKIIEALPGGRKPDVLIIGHYHKADFMPVYRNVPAFQAGCLQSQTPFMKTRALAAHLGFWMVEVHATKDGLGRVKGEFVPFFEV